MYTREQLEDKEMTIDKLEDMCFEFRVRYHRDWKKPQYVDALMEFFEKNEVGMSRTEEDPEQPQDQGRPKTADEILAGRLKGDVTTLIDRLRAISVEEVKILDDLNDPNPVKLRIGNCKLTYKRGVWLPIPPEFKELLENTIMEKDRDTLDEKGMPKKEKYTEPRYVASYRPIQRKAAA